jgi:membrane protein DedA with SNARE-associated domain
MVETLINEYRYLALMVGTFFEGETAILLASSLIYKGFFSGPHTVFFAFAGSFISDWVYYLVGRLNGKIFIERRPKLQAKVFPITNFFQKNRVQILLTYRFLYGFRVIIPVVIGMSGIRPRLFLFYTIVSGLIWATTVSLLGYVIGRTFNITTNGIKENLPVILAGFACFGLLLGYIIQKVVNKNVEVEPELSNT